MFPEKTVFRHLYPARPRFFPERFCAQALRRRRIDAFRHDFERTHGAQHGFTEQIEHFCGCESVEPGGERIADERCAGRYV